MSSRTPYAPASAREITSMCRSAGFPAQAMELIAAGVPMEEARRRVDHMKEMVVIARQHDLPPYVVQNCASAMARDDAVDVIRQIIAYRLAQQDDELHIDSTIGPNAAANPGSNIRRQILNSGRAVHRMPAHLSRTVKEEQEQ